MSGAASPISMLWFAAGLFLVAAFAWTRPLTLTDFENRKLARNVSAQVFFTILYLVLYVVLTAAFQYGGRIAAEIVDGAGWLGSVSQYMKTKSDQPSSFAPLLALGAIGWFQSLATLRELERTCLVYTYSARYMFTDVLALTRHLQSCEYVPTDAERNASLAALERLNVFVTDRDTALIDLRVVADWRKVDTLLRHLAEWNRENGTVLNGREHEELKSAATAHERKTGLALNIIRMLDHVSSGQGSAASVAEVSDLLAEAARGGAEARAAVASRIETAVERQASTAVRPPQPIYLSSLQLRSFLDQIQTYFEAEYRILLGQVSELAAKSIVHSGDIAPLRLRAMKLAGFRGLGRILPISFNRILWVFFAVLGASFVLFVLRQWLSMRGVASSVGMDRADLQRTMLLAGFISLTTAFAAIVGAAVGSTRRLAQSPRTPWRAYLAAGLVAITLFYITHATRIMLTSGIERLPPAPIAATATPGSPDTSAAAAPEPGARKPPLVRPPGLVQSTPWAFIPFMVTLAICLLARLAAWPLVGSAITGPGAAEPPATAPAGGTAPPRTAETLIPPAKPQLTPAARWRRMIVERTLDGIALGVAMALAIAVVLKLVFPLAQWIAPGSGIRTPPRLAAAMEVTWLPWSMVAMQFAIGFFIGALIIRDVRRAGHSRVVLTPVEAPPPLVFPRAAGRLPLPIPNPLQ